MVFLPPAVVIFFKMVVFLMGYVTVRHRYNKSHHNILNTTPTRKWVMGVTMVTRGASILSRFAALFAVVFVLSSCGGGGGSSGFIDGSSGGGNTGTPGETGDLEILLLDPDGESTTTVTAASNGTLRVLVPNGGADIVVEVSSSIGIVEPASGSALTDASGTAVFTIRAGSTTGAGTINATADLGAETLQGTLNFQVGESALILGYEDGTGQFVANEILIEPLSTLSAGGSAQLSVIIVDQDGARVTSPVDVTFDSGCISSGQATASPSVSQSVNGQALTLYTARGCTGLDTVNASLSGAAAVATGTLDVAAPDAGSLSFVSADPELIVLRGTGGVGRDETAEVIFRVVDGSGLPLQGVTVDFALTTDVGGVALVQDSVQSDGDGLVRVTVQAGDISTVLRVVATVDVGDGNPIATLSDQLTVSTGLPDKNSMSVGVAACGGGEGFMVENGMTINGICREIVVNMADKFNNPVVDGTAAVFTTEYGVIDSTCFTEAGECSVEWRSQDPRFPTDPTSVKTIFDVGYSCPSHDGLQGPCPDDLGYTRGGRSTILVHAIGEESFTDSNGNGVMDQSEAALFASLAEFANLPEAWVDHNEDGEYTPGRADCMAAPMGTAQCIAGLEEEFVDFNSSLDYDTNDSPALFNGLLCPVEGDGDWCSRELLNVYNSAVLTLLDDEFFGLLVDSSDSVVNAVTYYDDAVFYVSDRFNSPLAVGSSISVAATGDCVLDSPGSFQAPFFDQNGAWGIPIRVGLKVNPQGVASSVEITVSPKDVVSTIWEFDCVP
jgi:hypothetical protein